jgi:methylglutaconyl-CoA hydratase
MSESVLLYTVDNNVCLLILNRPNKRDALNEQLVQALKDGLDRAAANPEAHIVGIMARGKDFCAGADIAELEQLSTAGDEKNLANARLLGELFIKIRRHPKPVVSIVKGRALAGGCGLATACDIVLARDDCEFGYPEILLGFVPAMVMAILRRRIPEARAFELIANGTRIDAAEAERIGLVTRVFPAFTFAENVKQYLAELAKRNPEALTLTKRLLYDQDTMGFEDAIERGAQVNVVARNSDAYREGLRRFLASEPD